MRRETIQALQRHTIWLSLLGHLLFLMGFSVALVLAQHELPPTSSPQSVPSYLSPSPEAPPAPQPAPEQKVEPQPQPQPEPKEVDKQGIEKPVVKKTEKAKVKPAVKPKATYDPRTVSFSRETVPEDITNPRDHEPLRLVGENKIIKPLIKIHEREPARSCQTHAAAIPALAHAQRLAVAPRGQLGDPPVKGASGRIGIPALAQRHRIFPARVGELVDGLLERPERTGPVGRAERLARRRVRGDVEVEQFSGRDGIHQTQQRLGGASDRGPAVRVRDARHPGHLARVVDRERERDRHGRTIAADHELGAPLGRVAHRGSRHARELDGDDDLAGDPALAAEGTADVLGLDAHVG